MFAAKRTERVIGRIKLLMISMITIKGINGEGVPVGTRWAKKSVILLIRLNIINPNHKGRAKDKVIAKWLVAVKVKEAKPKALLKRINVNNLINIIMLIFLVLRRAENSPAIEKIIFLIIILKGELSTQKEGVKRAINAKSLNQLREIPKIAAGSKIEKRLFIIFNFALRVEIFCGLNLY